MDLLKLKVEGHVLIQDAETKEVILNRRNAVHRENMSFAIASSLSNSLNVDSLSGFIDSLAFGNGGVVVDGSGNITYNTVNVDNITDQLYNQTYVKNVNSSPQNNIDNNTMVSHSGGTTYSDIVVTSTLDYDEPLGQDPLDDTTDLEGNFVFDEIGLISQQGRLLTHLIFHPVQKSQNRKIQVVYTIRITTG